MRRGDGMSMISNRIHPTAKPVDDPTAIGPVVDGAPVLEGLYDGLLSRSGPYPKGWRPGLFALRGMAYLAWRLRSR